jgi:hypothetical protein
MYMYYTAEYKIYVKEFTAVFSTEINPYNPVYHISDVILHYQNVTEGTVNTVVLNRA